MNTTRSICWFALFAGLFSHTIAAEPAQANAVEARLRQALKDANAQLATAQADLAALQSGQGADSDEKKRLQDENDALKKKFEKDRAAIEKVYVDLQKRLSEQTKELDRTKEALEASRKEQDKWSKEAQTLTAKCGELELDRTALLRKVADREEKNLKLFLIGNEILARYENFGLGKALAAKEPFVGSTRAKLETLIQDYQDGLTALRVRH